MLGACGLEEVGHALRDGEQAAGLLPLRLSQPAAHVGQHLGHEPLMLA
jgi:hypothetical protein